MALSKKRPRLRERANPADLTFLQPQEVLVIDRALERLGCDGEIHLIVEEHRLSYIQTLIERVLVEHSRQGTTRASAARPSAGAKRI